MTRRRAPDRARVSRVRLHSVGPWSVVVLGGTLSLLFFSALALVWMPDDGWFHLGVALWEVLFVPGALAVTFASMSILSSYRSITVGTDGLLLVDLRRRETFHRHAEIDELSFGLVGANAVLRMRIAELDVPAPLEGERVYRGSAVTRETVWAILEDPSAAPQVRVRVAETLRVSMGEAPRLRIAALETASPEIHAAFRRAERRALAIDDEG